MKQTVIAIICILTSLASLAAPKKELRYVDASTLAFVNRAHHETPGFQRVDVDKYPELTPKVRYYYSFPTGIAVRFRTNSSTIDARWTTNDSIPGANCTAVAQKGLDLYIERDGRWVFAGIGRPKYTGTDHKSTIVTDMDSTMKECLLYLPLYSRLYKLEIGVDPDAVIEASVDRPKRRVVYLGSSLTHGIGANRPGMTYPAIISRRMGTDSPNFGASGQCKLEQFFAKIACDTEADAFVFDTFSNPSAEQINERLIPFIETVRRCHPDTPLIFLQTELRETSNFSTKKWKFEADKRAAAAAQMRVAVDRFPGVYFINPGFVLGSDHEATCDGTHPSDLGTMRVADALQPEIEEILRIEGIL